MPSDTPSSPRQPPESSDAEDYPVWKRWGDIDEHSKAGDSEPRDARAPETSDASAATAERSKNQDTERQEEDMAWARLKAQLREAANESAASAADPLPSTDTSTLPEPKQVPNGTHPNGTESGAISKPVESAAPSDEDVPARDFRSWEADFSALDIRDRVVIMLLFKQVVQIDEVEAAWRRFQRTNKGRSREPLWRILARDPAFDRNRILEEAAKSAGFERANFDPSAAAAFIDAHFSSFAEPEWERMLTLNVVPIEKEEDPRSGRTRFVFVAPDPTRPGVSTLLRDLNISGHVLRYAPERVIDSLLADLTGRGGFDDDEASTDLSTETPAADSNEQPASEHDDSAADGPSGPFVSDEPEDLTEASEYADTPAAYDEGDAPADASAASESPGAAEPADASAASESPEAAVPADAPVNFETAESPEPADARINPDTTEAPEPADIPESFDRSEAAEPADPPATGEPADRTTTAEPADPPATAEPASPPAPADPPATAESAVTPEAAEPAESLAAAAHTHTSPSHSADARKMFDDCLTQAVEQQASGIHFLPADDGLRIDMRINGELERWQICSHEVGDELLAVVKDEALNIEPSELDSVQDGLIKRQVGDATVRFRVSILPIAGSFSEDRRESIVISVLGEDTAGSTLDGLGLPDETLAHLRTAIAEPRGMVVLAGPSGSGKGTTLGAILSEIVTPKVNVITLEESVTHEEQGVRQVRLNHKLDHEDALEAVRRHDPDIILVGELRTKETAELALKLANAGHLVFSRVPAHDTTGAVGRLFRLGVDPFLIAYAINLVVAQRLVRSLCPDCKQPSRHIDGELLRKLGFSRQEIASAKFFDEGEDDCTACRGQRYKGHEIIAESMPFTHDTRRLIALADKALDDEDIRAHAVREGMTTIRSSAREVVLRGDTSVGELIRVTAGAK